MTTAPQTSQKKGKNIIWNDQMDKVLVDSLLVQITEGYKISNGFKDPAYVAAATTMNAFFNLQLNKEHIKNRIKTMKETYKSVCIILSRSGFGFDDDTKMVTCKKEVYDDYVAANPKHKKHLHHVLHDDMCKIFGDEFAKGARSRTHENPSIASSQPVSLDDIGDNFADDHTPMSHHPPSPEADPTIGGSETSPLRRAGTRRQRTRQDGAHLDSMSRLSTSMDKVADALTGACAPAYLAQLREAVRGVGGFSQDILLRTTEYLTVNPSLAHLFIMYEEEERRSYIRRKMARFIRQQMDD
ncbi:uncharacterized protein LOC143885196 isoform X2 [Tasmannia lanceolata]|uniref:uncharacterized protein LOC143885196 isoform X2 n=1 Tax=Tasmannia lanceolata TaxID=3420 RepID=UPI004062FDE9